MSSERILTFTCGLYEETSTLQIVDLLKFDQHCRSTFLIDVYWGSNYNILYKNTQYFHLQIMVSSTYELFKFSMNFQSSWISYSFSKWLYFLMKWSYTPPPFLLPKLYWPIHDNVVIEHIVESSFQHMCFWYLFMDPHLTTHKYKCPLRWVTELGFFTWHLNAFGVRFGPLIHTTFWNRRTWI